VFLGRLSVNCNRKNAGGENCCEIIGLGAVFAHFDLLLLFENEQRKTDTLNIKASACQKKTINESIY